ncbi:unnamed protein product, partial [Ectocarpus sp. 8 AP-2014]
MKPSKEEGGLGDRHERRNHEIGDRQQRVREQSKFDAYVQRVLKPTPIRFLWRGKRLRTMEQENLINPKPTQTSIPYTSPSRL